MVRFRRAVFRRGEVKGSAVTVNPRAGAIRHNYQALLRQAIDHEFSELQLILNDQDGETHESTHYLAAYSNIRRPSRPKNLDDHDLQDTTEADDPTEADATS